jgi:hypothetical protein
MSGNSEREKVSELEQVDEAWNFSLFDAIMSRRSRRFGVGMEITEGPNKFKSTNPPIPLDELEEALLIAAGTGVTGLNLGDLPWAARPEKIDQLQNWCGEGNTLVEYAGRSWPSACGAHGTELFYTNDEGVYLLKLREAQPSKFCEYEGKSDRDKLVEFVRDNRVKLFDGRLDIPRNTGAIYSFNLWNMNMPGTTLFMPVSDITEEYINIIMLSADFGQYLIDDRNGHRPTISQKWIKEGWVDTPIPLTMIESSMMCTVGGAEGAFIGHNITLALQAMGLGGWLFGGAVPFVVMGGTPMGQGLGFRFEANPKDPNAFSVPVGIDGGFESYRPPYFKSMDEAVDAIVARKFGPNGAFNPFSDKQAPYKNQADFLRQIPRTPEKSIEICKETCRYIWDTYGTFPATVAPMALLYYIQAQHCELEFYDKYYPAGAYLKTHKQHMDRWHKKAGAARSAA